MWARGGPLEDLTLRKTSLSQKGQIPRDFTPPRSPESSDSTRHKAERWGPGAGAGGGSGGVSVLHNEAFPTGMRHWPHSHVIVLPTTKLSTAIREGDKFYMVRILPPF